MKQRELRTIELDDTSSEHPLASRGTSQPPANRRSTIFGVAAVLLVVAMGAAIFASLSARHPSQPAQATGQATAHSQSGTQAGTQTGTQAGLQSGAPLPEGVEVTAFAPTGADDGWAAANVITNPVTGFPDRSMVLHYSGGAWTQVGDALPAIRLGGIDMVSDAEGWVLGGDTQAKGVLLHISNGAWQRVALPSVDPQGAPSVMRMRTSGEGWLVMANPKGSSGQANTSLLHDAGGAWSLVSTGLLYISDLAPVADGEAWVVGSNRDGTSSLVHVTGGVAAVQLTSPGNSSFTRVRFFAPNNIWVEGAMHADTNADVDDLPLLYHYDGAAWAHADLHAPKGVQHVETVTGSMVWGFASLQAEKDAASGGVFETDIATLYTYQSGQWTKLALPYADLQSIDIVSTETDGAGSPIWAVGMYMLWTQVPNHNGATSYAGIGHNVLLRYANGTWTKFGR